MTSRHELLAGLHHRLRPRGYLEIGVDRGQSMALATCPAIGIDPTDRRTVKSSADAEVHTMTSDEFFARPDPLRHLPGRTLDLAFIDGMHLVEYALRDLINVERHSHPGTVLVLDDMLPRNVEEAARDRFTRDWTGDVYKLIAILAEHRPDLACVPLDTTPTGVVVILGLDRANQVLTRRYDQIVAAALTPDPQDVPASVLHRTGALDPQSFLDSPLIPWLIAQRGSSPHLPGASGRVARRTRATLLGAVPGLGEQVRDRVFDVSASALRVVRPRTRMRRVVASGRRRLGRP